MILLKLAVSLLIALLITCIFGIFFAGDQQAQAILKPLALCGSAALGMVGIVAAWKYIK